MDPDDRSITIRLLFLVDNLDLKPFLHHLALVYMI